ncbi:MAG: M48 family metallopeptidase [Deltaproteobacteria bacterium]|nr:M48 family metallopeptidase [Deltaproteobacteria bacterium]
MMEKGMIHYGGEQIGFNVLFVNRKTMEIAVHPDKRVIVKAPLDTDWSHIEKRVRKRVRWIVKQIVHFSQFEPRTPPRSYVSGETHLYLGKQYRLKVITGERDSVKVMRRQMMVTIKGRISADRVKDCLLSWYRKKAWEKMPQIYETVMGRFKQHGYDCPQLQIRKMKTRWGSLSQKGRLTLNLSLIRVPKDCIEYVITHELCHIQFNDHSAGFYKLLEELMPDWQRRKNRLEITTL